MLMGAGGRGLLVGWYLGSVTRLFSCQAGAGLHWRERSGAEARMSAYLVVGWVQHAVLCDGCLGIRCVCGGALNKRSEEGKMSGKERAVGAMQSVHGTALAVVLCCWQLLCAAASAKVCALLQA